MHRPPPLHLHPHALAPTAQLQQLRLQLDDQLAIADGARALLQRVEEGTSAGGEGDLTGSLPNALREELYNADVERARLENEIRTLELQIAAGVPAPLSPAPPPSSAIANGFSLSSSLDGSFSLSSSYPTPHLPPSTPLPPAEPDLQQSLTLVVDLLSRLETEVLTVAERVRAMDRVVEVVERQPEVKYELRLEEVLPSITACLSESAGKDVRASVYRVLRHLVVDLADVEHLSQAHLPLFLIRSLARDTPFNLEKEHALRLIRVLLPFATPEAVLPNTGREVVPVAVMRAVVAIAETVEEKLRLSALETLVELVIHNLPLLSLSGGLRVVLQLLLDGPYDLSPSLSLLFLSAFDRPESRQWLRPGVDVEVVLAGFTEVQPKGAGAEERVKACASVVGGWLGSWSGFFYLNIHGRQALTSLVDSLTNPSQAIRETLLDMLFSVFNFKTPAWYTARGNSRSSFSANGFSTPLPPVSPSPSSASPSSSAPKPSRRGTNLLDQYHALLLLVFIEAGLVEALASLAADPMMMKDDDKTARKTSLLIAEVLELGNRVLPPVHAVRLQALPRLFALTSSFDTSSTRLAASDALLAVGHHDRERRVGKLTAVFEAAAAVVGDDGATESRDRANSAASASASHAADAPPSLSALRQISTSRLTSALQLDDTTFRLHLLESGVLSTKDHTKWNFEVVRDLLEGPLRKPKRLEEATRGSKWVKRVAGFYWPFGGRYGELSKAEEGNVKWTRLGCTLLETLLSSPDGVAFLAEDKLLRQISDCLFQLDPQLGSANPAELVFSKDRMANTLTSGHFEMLSVLTRTAEGVRLLDQVKVFTAFYRISELRSRDELVKAIIENMDYTLDGHPRVFLSKALTSSYKHIRLFATQHLASLLHLCTSSHSSPCPSSSSWLVSLLVQQLYDSAPEVVRFAVETLDRACEVRETLEVVVGMRPALDLLGEVGERLLTRFLSTEVGVEYLDEIDFIERELDEWFNHRNLLYVVELELALASVFQTDGGLCTPSTPFDGTPPTHFYGELVKTDRGCEILRDSEHFDTFADVIDQHGDAVEKGGLDEAYVMTLKSVLWAVGHIGSTVHGLALLDDEGVLPDMVQIAAFSPVYSLRGTATFALALISQTEEGAEMLEELGWESVSSPICGPTGICVPVYLGDYIFTPLWDPPLLSLPTALSLPPPTSPLEITALTALANLSNHILATKASKALARLKSRHRSLFTSSGLYYRALEMLASHHYRLAVRKYVLELFEVPLDKEVAGRIELAGEELRRRKSRAVGEGAYGQREAESLSRGYDVDVGEEGGRSRGVEGEVTEDDDESSGDEADDDDGESSKIPLQVLTPLVTVKGFLLA